MLKRFFMWLGLDSDVSCPNCCRIYDPMLRVEDWGVAVGSEDGHETSFDICGCCLSNPKTIELRRVENNHRKRGTPPSEIEQGITQLQRLKSGEVTPEEIV